MIWSRDDRWKSLIVATDGVEIIDEAHEAGRGVLMLVPHFGNWEILNLFLGCPLRAHGLVRPATRFWLRRSPSRGSDANR